MPLHRPAPWPLACEKTIRVRFSKAAAVIPHHETFSTTIYLSTVLLKVESYNELGPLARSERRSEPMASSTAAMLPGRGRWRRPTRLTQRPDPVYCLHRTAMEI